MGTKAQIRKFKTHTQKEFFLFIVESFQEGIVRIANSLSSKDAIISVGEAYDTSRSLMLGVAATAAMSLNIALSDDQSTNRKILQSFSEKNGSFLLTKNSIFNCLALSDINLARSVNQNVLLEEILIFRKLAILES